MNKTTRGKRHGKEYSNIKFYVLAFRYVYRLQEVPTVIRLVLLGYFIYIAKTVFYIVLNGIIANLVIFTGLGDIAPTM